jgi:hypothetical protein
MARTARIIEEVAIITLILTFYAMLYGVGATILRNMIGG